MYTHTCIYITGYCCIDEDVFIHVHVHVHTFLTGCCCIDEFDKMDSQYVHVHTHVVVVLMDKMASQHQALLEAMRLSV